MKTKDFFFNLPEELIAQDPSAERGESRLFLLDRQSGANADSMVRDLPELISPGTLMVFNDSRVRKARLYGRGMRDGKEREFLLVRQSPSGAWEFLCKGRKGIKPGDRFVFPENIEAAFIEDDPGLLSFGPGMDEAYLERCGHVPLPPYIKRPDRGQDAERYQTVYSKLVGSSAAPTAGLHFSQELFGRLQNKGIETAFVTLHVGLGTFLPVRSESIEDHRMHAEEFCVSHETAVKFAQAKAEGRPVLAVGTTSLRSLESAYNPESAGLRTGWQSTSIFISPGYTFQVVDQLFTNFHTPESTLLMLVSAFAGFDRIMQAYREAIEKRYRFFSYGDAMLIR